MDHLTTKSTNETISLRAWLIWSVGLSFALFQFFIQLSSGILVNAVSDTFALSAVGVGLLTSSYYFIYTLLQIPAGLLIDRFGPRLLCSCAAVCIAIGCYFYASTNNVLVAAAGRMLMGAGGSVSFIAVVHLIRTWFPLRYFALMVGATETMGMSFTVFANLYLASAITRFGWRDCVYVIGLTALLISVAYYFIVKNHHSGASHTPSSANTQLSFKKMLRITVSNRNLWLNGIYSGLLFSPVSVFSALWGIPFLMQDAHFDLQQSTIASCMVLLGVGVGSPIVGYLASRRGRFKGIMSGSALMTAVLFTILLFDAHPQNNFLYAILFCIGLTSSAYVLTFPLASLLSPEGTHSTSIGFTNALCVIAAPIYQPAIGYLLNCLASKHSHAHSYEYNLHDYQYALLLIPASIVIAGLLILLVDEKQIVTT